MAKTVKKSPAAAKPAAKNHSKASSKNSAKPAKAKAKPAAPAKKAASKAVAAKPAARPAAKKDEKAKKPLRPTPVAAKPTKPSKVDAKAKKPKRDAEMEDEDLMVSDEDLGAEEIPDLSEFEEDEEITVEDTESDESVAPAAAAPAVKNDDEAVLTDAEGRPYCKVKDCDQIAAVDSYCRYHYLLLWKKIQVRRKILIDGKLERYVEELTSRYPDKFLEMIKRDLRTEKDFQAAIAELEIDETGLDGEFEDESQVLDEVRGFGSESSISDEEEF